ncbi:MAG: hypothetical protein HY930_06880 [Euryarchaeota archaeon]|nr:hypothetical protein [Euryarchaeota archaeon]
MTREKSIVFVLLFFLLFETASAEPITQSGLTVTWYPVQEGIGHFIYNISVQNLGEKRAVNFSTIFSETSFDISQLNNIKFYEWENASSIL